MGKRFWREHGGRRLPALNARVNGGRSGEEVRWGIRNFEKRSGLAPSLLERRR